MSDRSEVRDRCSRSNCPSIQRSWWPQYCNRNRAGHASCSGAVHRSARALVGGGEVSFNVKSARFHTNKHDSALSGIANPHALHSRAHHLNISPPAGPRWWHTPSSQHGTSSTRSQRETSARAGAHRIGTTTRAARRPSSYPRGMPRLHARET